MSEPFFSHPVMPVRTDRVRIEAIRNLACIFMYITTLVKVSKTLISNYAITKRWYQNAKDLCGFGENSKTKNGLPDWEAI